MKDHKNIKNELEEISPFLANLKKPNDGFEVPKDYFQHLENNIFARIKAEKEVEAWSVSETETAQRTPTQSWIKRLMNWFAQPQVSLSFATMIVVGIGLALFQTNNQPDTIGMTQIDWTTDEAIASLTIDEVNQYVEENVEEFSEELLSEVTEDVLVIEETIENVAPSEPETETEIESDFELDIEDIEEYIEDNLSDFDESILLEDY